MKTTLTKIGKDAGFAIPKDILDRLGWKVGDVLNLYFDGTVLELRADSVSEQSTDDFNRQLEHARHAMRKYHVALTELAKS
ncbi:SpoVT/AbrB family transcriptional regulatory protein [Agrobacterium sp. ATCC 31749]|uniref:hypothetical protein n=1 Tax=Agrobacterium TaxID=357 RepID=UPI00020DB973|nr:MULTISPECIES: hypothetical protein [Agrobacterium]EGL64987.1 SpoVT/AbrB family transcriptional regulatory protein [Agrobacterium sp. ATCC 31749]NTB06998.1 AbrB/MazE/SpoVT family DNA-binding domain-containing protein [Agrobacterium fabrum]QKW96412.1 AbrB/MazE/SpoVT family DNA-binding domain-containing protein [Agrobacterium sp. CGMCC 11546]